MAGAKETPRQKMIGMMYLVLTALLALQVSSAIIEKFHFLNQSLERARVAATAANENRLKSISDQVTKEKLAANFVHLKQAEDVKAKTAEMIAYLEGIKGDLVKETGGLKPDGSYQNPSGETQVESFMVGGTKNGKGYELKKKLEEYVSYFNTIGGKYGESGFAPLAVEPKDMPNIKDLSQRNKDFSEFNFAQTPMVAALATISQKQSELTRYEAALLEKIAAKVNAVPVAKFDKILAMVRPEAKVVAAGTKYKAEMFIAASSSGVSPRMSYNGQNIPVTNGMGKVEFTASGGAYDKDGNAKKTWTGTITIPKAGGGDTTFRHTEEYIVAKPVIQVQSQSVQALYANCGNKLNVAVPALGATYSPSFSGSTGGSFIPGGNKGDVTIVPTATQVTLKVSSNGNFIGSQNFKVRPIPRPTIRVSSLNRELPEKTGVDAPGPRQIEVRAVAEEGFANLLPDDARYNVSAFEVTLVRGRRPVAGPTRFSSSQANISGLTSQARPGDRLLIDVKSVKRMNFRGAIEEAKISGSTIRQLPLN